MVSHLQFPIVPPCPSVPSGRLRPSDPGSDQLMGEPLEAAKPGLRPAGGRATRGRQTRAPTSWWESHSRPPNPGSDQLVGEPLEAVKPGLQPAGGRATRGRQTRAPTSWWESHSRPSNRPAPVVVSHAWMCQHRLQHSLNRLNCSTISSSDRHCSTSYRHRYTAATPPSHTDNCRAVAHRHSH